MVVTANKFNIGDSVSSVKTGLPGVGYIIGILPIGCGLSCNLIKIHNIETWNERFDIKLQAYDWLYIVGYDEYRYTASIEDLMRIYPGIDRKAAEVLQSQMPKANAASYCEADLEKFE